MNLVITFKNLEHTEALDAKIREKSDRFKKYFQGKTNVKWTCYVKGGDHFAELDISGPRFGYHATANSESLYKTLDMVIHKMERQLTKKKEKGKNHIHNHAGDKPLVILDPEDAWIDHDEDKYDDTAF